MSNYLRNYTVAEFRGSFPQITIDQRVDIDALTKGDDDPFFVTLPIARVGETSVNGLVYDEELVTAIEQQVVGKGGIMGHLKDEERNTSFPIEAIDWVGVMRQENTVWGKGYIPPGEAREYTRRLMARGGRLATSIYGPYQEQLPGEAEGSHHIRGLRLEQLDLAPADRAALQLGGEFAITAQMNNDNNDLEDADMATKQEIIAELTVNDLPENLRKQIISEFQATNDNKALIAELTQERNDAKTLVETLQKEVQAYQAKEFETALNNTVAELIDWKIEDEAAKEKVNAFRRTVRGRILAELQNERDAEKVKAVAETVWEEMKPLAETLKLALSGGAAFVPGHPRNNGRTLEVTPEAIAAARGAMGL